MKCSKKFFFKVDWIFVWTHSTEKVKGTPCMSTNSSLTKKEGKKKERVINKNNKETEWSGIIYRENEIVSEKKKKKIKTIREGEIEKDELKRKKEKENKKKVEKEREGKKKG